MVETVAPSPAPTVPVVPGGAGTDGGRLRLAAPFVALALVVAAAWFGARPAGVAVADGTTQRLPSGDAAAASAPAGSSRTVLLPASTLGLPVLSAADLRAMRAGGRQGDGAVAVAGVMRSDPLPLYCGAIRQTLSRDFCIRLVALFPATAQGSAPSPSDAGPVEPVSGIVAPGVALPPVVVSSSDLAPWLNGNVPVIFIAHYGDERAPACPGPRGWCRDDLVLERLAWMGGSDLPVASAADPALDVAATAAGGPAAATLRGWLEARRAQLLSTVVIGAPGLKGVVDQPLRDRGGVVAEATWWYARVLLPASLAGPATVAWLVMDARTGTVLATNA